MDPITIIVIIAVLFVLSRGGVSLGTNLFGSPQVPQGIRSAPAPDPTAAEAGLAQQVGGLLNAIPVVGPGLSQAFDAITGGLLKASEQRRKAAVNENAAVAAAIPGWDQAVAWLNQAYNNGQITADQAQQVLTQAWGLYWKEVGPVIQPGRNGCQSGAMSKADADRLFPGMKQCGGSWGAACCVGYADLANGARSISYAIQQTENTGKPMAAQIPSISASKYGGISRPAYTLTFTRSR